MFDSKMKGKKHVVKHEPMISMYEILEHTLRSDERIRYEGQPT